MARAGQTIENPATGERITFVRTTADTGGELLVMDSVWTRPGHCAPAHAHPEIEERWRVVSGRACFRIGDDEIDARPGDEVVAPPGITHVAWNPTDAEVRLRIEMRPALRWEEFVERLFADPRSAPELLPEFSRELRV